MPNIYNISSAANFFDALAQGVLARFERPEEVTIFVPTKRAIVELKQAFASAHKAEVLLLPKIYALGDVDEDELFLQGFPHVDKLPESYSQNERVFKLAQLFFASNSALGANELQALQISAKLCSLLDEFYNRDLSFEALSNLVPADFSEQWQVTTDFLQIITHQWQDEKRKNGRLDAVERRNLLLKKLAEFWRKFPPHKPIIIAGTTATIPATQELIASALNAQNGYLLLFGLDSNLSAADFAKLEPTHPQFNLAQLLRHLQFSPAHVLPWQAVPQTKAQEALSTALLPSWRVHEWQEFLQRNAGAAPLFELIEGKSEEESAELASFVLREFVHNFPAEKAVLVTQNLVFARRVQAKLARWKICAVDSFARKLSDNLFAEFFLQLAELFIGEQNPADVLIALKNQVIKPSIAECVGAIELQKNSGFRGLAQAGFCLSNFNFGVDKQLILRLEQSFAEQKVGLSDGVVLIFQLVGQLADLEKFAQDWQEFCTVIDDVKLEVSSFSELSTKIFISFLRQIFALKKLPRRKGGKSQIEILSPQDARFNSAKLVLIAGMNEGELPQISGLSDIINQQMRKNLGLDLPAKKIGQQAHDFELLCQAERVVFLRAKRGSAAQEIPSRFLQCLENLQVVWRNEQYASWLKSLHSSAVLEPCEQPRPKPPANARPKKLYATDVGTLIKDPYSIYAKKILQLKKLDDIAKQPDHSDFGNFLHKVAEDFTMQPEKTLPKFMAIGEQIFCQQYNNSINLRSFWLPKLYKAAEQILQLELLAIETKSQVFAEIAHEIELPNTNGFLLGARADRVERMGTSIAVYDYKSGTLARKKEVVQGFAPQILLCGLVFSVKFGLPAQKLTLLKIGGNEDQTTLIGGELEEGLQQTLGGLCAMIESFSRAETPYTARPHPKFALAYNDFAHLARIEEWS